MRELCRHERRELIRLGDPVSKGHRRPPAPGEGLWENVNALGNGCSSTPSKREEPNCNCWAMQMLQQAAAPYVAYETWFARFSMKHWPQPGLGDKVTSLSPSILMAFLEAQPIWALRLVSQDCSLGALGRAGMEGLVLAQLQICLFNTICHPFPSLLISLLLSAGWNPALNPLLSSHPFHLLFHYFFWSCCWSWYRTWQLS